MRRLVVLGRVPSDADAMIESGFPTLEVADLERAVTFYTGTLGGEVTDRFPEDGDAVSVSLSMGSSKLGIGLGENASAPTGVVLWFSVNDVDSAT